MQTLFHPASDRGYADFGWLQSSHTFSFGNYFDASKMGFGVLRVLNDDHVAAGQGFSTHPHSNMEIISIPLEGDLEHRDSLGNVAVIKEGDVQVMSAGTGITHSEYNHNTDRAVKFLQIWVKPSQINVEPRYGQITLNPAQLKNKWELIVGPKSENIPTWINQNAWFYLADLDKDLELDYKLHDPNNGVYLFVIEGSLLLDSAPLKKRDGIGISHTDQFKVQAQTTSRILLMEIPA